MKNNQHRLPSFPYWLTGDLSKIYKGSLSLLQSDAAVTHTPSGRNENIKVDQKGPEDNIFIKQVTPRYPYHGWKNVV